MYWSLNLPNNMQAVQASLVATRLLAYLSVLPFFLYFQVYVDVLSSEDLLLIVSTLYPSFERNMLQKMITFNAKV